MQDLSACKISFVTATAQVWPVIKCSRCLFSLPIRLWCPSGNWLKSIWETWYCQCSPEEAKMIPRMSEERLWFLAKADRGKVTFLGYKLQNLSGSNGWAHSAHISWDRIIRIQDGIFHSSWLSSPSPPRPISSSPTVKGQNWACWSVKGIFSLHLLKHTYTNKVEHCRLQAQVKISLNSFL